MAEESRVVVIERFGDGPFPLLHCPLSVKEQLPKHLTFPHKRVSVTELLET